MRRSRRNRKPSRISVSADSVPDTAWDMAGDTAVVPAGALANRPWGGERAASPLMEKEMMWGYDGFGMGWGGTGIGMLLFWGLIIAAIAILARGFGERPAGNEPRLREKKPLDILGEPYAKGEIDKREFEKKRRDLEESGSMPMDKHGREFLKAGG